MYHEFDLTNFPYDIHNLNFTFVPWIYQSGKQTLEIHSTKDFEDPIKKNDNYFTKNDQFDIEIG